MSDKFCGALTEVPADGHDASHLELERVIPDKVVSCLERVAKQPTSEGDRAEAVARLAAVV